MKKLILTSLAALAVCACPPNAAFAASSSMTVTNNCNRLVHVTVQSGGHFGGVTLDANQSSKIETIEGKVYHAQVFEGYAPVVPYDWRTDIAHNANLNVVSGGLFGGFCTFE